MVTWFYPTVRKTHTAQITCNGIEHVHHLFWGGEIPVSNSNPSAQMV